MAVEGLVERIVRAPLGAKVGAVALVAVLLTALNYFAVGVPAFGLPVSELDARIRRADGEQQRVDAEYLEKTAIANNLNQFRREKELLEQRLADALSELPDDKRIDELLQLFQDRATKAGLEILTIEPQPQVSEGFYARVPIPMSIQGNYHEIATFLDALGRLRRIVNVNNLTLESPKDVNGKVVLTSKFLATTFMFVDAKDAKPAAGAKP